MLSCLSFDDYINCVFFVSLASKSILMSKALCKQKRSLCYVMTRQITHPTFFRAVSFWSSSVRVTIPCWAWFFALRAKNWIRYHIRLPGEKSKRRTAFQLFFLRPNPADCDAICFSGSQGMPGVRRVANHITIAAKFCTCLRLSWKSNRWPNLRQSSTITRCSTGSWPQKVVNSTRLHTYSPPPTHNLAGSEDKLQGRKFNRWRRCKFIFYDPNRSRVLARASLQRVACESPCLRIEGEVGDGKRNRFTKFQMTKSGTHHSIVAIVAILWGYSYYKCFCYTAHSESSTNAQYKFSVWIVSSNYFPSSFLGKQGKCHGTKVSFFRRQVVMRRGTRCFLLFMIWQAKNVSSQRRAREVKCETILKASLKSSENI